jgi:SPP1 family predicted phage head-tail adaptor
MRAGGRETRIEVLVGVETKDPRFNNKSFTWQVERSLWSAYTSKKGREFYDAGKLISQNAAQFEVDWMDGQGITDKHRIRCNGQDYNIKSIDEDLDLKRRVIIEAVAGLNETQS